MFKTFLEDELLFLKNEHDTTKILTKIKQKMINLIHYTINIRIR